MYRQIIRLIGWVFIVSSLMSAFRDNFGGLEDTIAVGFLLIFGAILAR